MRRHTRRNAAAVLLALWGGMIASVHEVAGFAAGPAGGAAARLSTLDGTRWRSVGASPGDFPPPLIVKW